MPSLGPPELIERFLKVRKMRAAELCRRTGILPSMISLYRRGLRKAGLETALTLERATDGAVPASSWVNFVPGPPPPNVRRFKQAS
jgi:transcriptional regulator with XRE-family HTH domain